jgi:hypothetical protein
MPSTYLDPGFYEALAEKFQAVSVPAEGLSVTVDQPEQMAIIGLLTRRAAEIRGDHHNTLPGRFMRWYATRYKALRGGTYIAGRMDYHEAEALVGAFPDRERLKLIVDVFLQIDGAQEKILRGTRTIAMLRAYAPGIDERIERDRQKRGAA